MDPVREAHLDEGLGITGNANRGGKRQVTIISKEVWARHMAKAYSSAVTFGWTC